MDEVHLAVAGRKESGFGRGALLWEARGGSDLSAHADNCHLRRGLDVHSRSWLCPALALHGANSPPIAGVDYARGVSAPFFSCILGPEVPRRAMEMLRDTTCGTRGSDSQRRRARATLCLACQAISRPRERSRRVAGRRRETAARTRFIGCSAPARSALQGRGSSSPDGRRSDTPTPAAPAAAASSQNGAHGAPTELIVR